MKRFRLFLVMENVFIVHNSNRPMVVRYSHGSPSSPSPCYERFFLMFLQKKSPLLIPPQHRNASENYTKEHLLKQQLSIMALCSIRFLLIFSSAVIISETFSLSHHSVGEDTEEFSSSHILMSPRRAMEMKDEQRKKSWQCQSNEIFK